jgi:hypothetical protein
MAPSPVLYFQAASFVLESLCQVIAAVVLGVGHVCISLRERLRFKGREQGAEMRHPSGILGVFCSRLLLSYFREYVDVT